MNGDGFTVDPDTGDTVLTSSQGGGTNANDVWGTVGRTVSALRDVAVAKLSRTSNPNNRTNAAPGGFLGSGAFNPFPGMFSPYPQADGKSIAGNAGGGGLNPMFLILAAIVLVVLFAFRGR